MKGKGEGGMEVIVIEKELYMISMWFPACVADRSVMRRHDFLKIDE